MRDERAETEGGESSADQHDQHSVLEGIWQTSWGLRLSLGLVAVLIWAGAMSAPSSPQPVTGTSVSPPVTTPVMAPTSPAPSTVDPSTVDPAPASVGLPQQPLDITYDYGPGPQPVPGAAPSP